MEVCIDKDDQTTLNKLALTKLRVVDSQGRFTLSQIDAIADDLAKNILADAETNPLIVARNKYGDGIYAATDYLNGLLRQQIGDLTEFPDLDARWTKGNISNLETADFLKAYNYTPSGLTEENDSRKLARNLDSYYKNDFSSSLLGGFCDRFDSIFASIDAFFDLIGVVEGIVTDVLNFIDKVRTYDGLKDLTVKGLIEKLIKEIKKKIEEVIDAIFQEVQDMIDNFDPSKIVEGFETFVDKSVVKGIMTAREQMCALFTDENKKGIKDKVLGLIDYAISLFESPGIEEIQFLIARICSMAASIEALIRDIKSPLDNYANRYSQVVDRLKTISNINSGNAIAAGAIRYSPTTRQEVINRLEGRWTKPDGKAITNTGKAPTNIVPITAKDYKDLPKCGKVFKGDDPTFGVEGDSFDEKDGIGIYAYTRIDLDVKVYLKRLQKLTGEKIIIVDGWVSKAYNKKIEGSEENSHLSGLVVDIKKKSTGTGILDIIKDPVKDLLPGSVKAILPGISDPAKFIEDALNSGFKYVKEYDDFIHLDIREII